MHLTLAFQKQNPGHKKFRKKQTKSLCIMLWKFNILNIKVYAICYMGNNDVIFRPTDNSLNVLKENVPSFFLQIKRSHRNSNVLVIQGEKLIN